MEERSELSVVIDSKVYRLSGGSDIYLQKLASYVDGKIRELRPLQAIRDHYPKIILTMDEEPEEQYEGIRRINARDWLLGIVD